MKRLFSASGLLCLAVASHATLIFGDDFETGDFSKWTAAPPLNGTSVISIAESVSPTHSAYFAAQGVTASATDVRYANLGTAIPSDWTVSLSFWMKLNQLSGSARQFVSIRSYSGDSVNNGSLDQVIAIGAYNSVNYGTWDSTKYQARVAFAPTGTAGWYNLGTATAARSTNWTKFTIEVQSSTVNFYVNDVLGLTVTGANALTLDSITMGSGISSGTAAAGSGMYVDDLRVDAVPEPATLAVLALGALGLIRRRR